MELIKRKTDYAIRAISYIAASDKDFVSTAELNECIELPRPFMRKIFQTLQKNGYLESVKGNKGGFSLRMDPDKIFIVDLIELFQGKIKVSNCVLIKKQCPNLAFCKVRTKINKIEKYILKEFDGVTIASIL